MYISQMDGFRINIINNLKIMNFSAVSFKDLGQIRKP